MWRNENMKKNYEVPEMSFQRILDADIITASGNDDIVPDLWSGGVSPQLIP